MFQMALTRSLPLRQCTVSNFLQSFRYASTKPDFDSLVKNNKVVVFMKGTPKAPRCGFSASVVQLLRMYGVEYDAHDVLSDEEMRQGIKDYTSWPTIPQVFFNGEFVGGCDILMQMHFDKKLSAELEKAGIKCTPPSGSEEKSSTSQ